MFCTKNETADLVLIGGKVVTVDENNSVTQALAVKGDKILALGSNEEIRRLVDSKTKVIDLQGQTAIPGFIDGHAHFLGLGYSKMQVDLSQAKSWEEIIEKIKQSAGHTAPGQWIIGHGWHQEHWTSVPADAFEGYPVHDRLSAITPDNPVYLIHGSGHAILANQKALEAAKITSATPDPEGGRIVRQPNGALTGVVLENAEALIANAYEESRRTMTAEQKRAELSRAAELAVQECLQNGITSFHDAGATFEEIDFFKSLVDEGKLGVRLWAMIGEGNEALKQKIQQYKIIGYGDQRLTVRSIKRFMDGALGSRSAWMLEPYDDLPTSTGINTIELDDLEETARLALENGFQLCTHAIGDLANRKTLEIYEKIFKAHPDKKDLRWRIEHAQHLNAADIPRFGQLGVIAAMQGCHATSDGPFVPKRLGDKRSEEGAYVWKKVMNSGALLNNGTDAPVEKINPIANFYSLVTRRMADGRQFFPEQCLTREEALRASTVNNAFSAFEENIKGSLEVGKLADITVLSQDILSVPEEKINDTRIVYTLIGGEIVFQQ